MKFLNRIIYAIFTIVLVLGTYHYAKSDIFVGPATITKTAPAYLYDFGSGVEADPNGNATLQGFHQYANFTVPIATTVTIGNTTLRTAGAPQSGLYVKSPGTCTVTGTIDGNARGMANGGTVGFGGSSGGGGGGAQTTNAGIVAANQTLYGTYSYASGGTAGAVGAVGGNGNAMLVGPPSNQILLVEWLPSIGLWGGTPGGNGGAGTSAGGIGGTAGAGLILDCNIIVCTGTVQMNGAVGGNGVAGANASGAGGGAGGGFIVFAGYSITDGSCTKTVTGGNGGTGTGGSGAGGIGAAGWALDFTL